MRSEKNAPGLGSSTCKGPEVGTGWFLGFERISRRREGQEEVGMTGPENGGPVSQAKTLGFVLRAVRKLLLHGLKQGSQSGSRFRRITHWVGEQEERSRARGQGGVTYKHLNRGDGGMDRWRLRRWKRIG